MALITALNKLAVGAPRGWDLARLLDETTKQLPDLEAHKVAVTRFRRLRDRVQHDGIIPSKEDADSMLLMAESFIRELVRSVYGLEIEHITLSSSLSDDQTRAEIQHAERCLESHDYVTAVSKAAIAFSLGRSRLRRIRMSNNPYSPSLADKFKRSLEMAIEDALDYSSLKVNDTSASPVGEFATSLARNLIMSRGIEDVFDELSEPFELASFGIDINDFILFNRLKPYILWTLGSELPEAVEPDDWSPSQQEAMFAVEFAVTSLIHFERAAHELHTAIESAK